MTNWFILFLIIFFVSLVFTNLVFSEKLRNSRVGTLSKAICVLSFLAVVFLFIYNLITYNSSVNDYSDYKIIQISVDEETYNKPHLKFFYDNGSCSESSQFEVYISKTDNYKRVYDNLFIPTEYYLTQEVYDVVSKFVSIAGERTLYNIEEGITVPTDAKINIENVENLNAGDGFTVDTIKNVESLNIDGLTINNNLNEGEE